MAPPELSIQPPLLNSASPWATSKEHLQSLLTHPSTGAITTRTCLTTGFDHDPSRHQYLFYNPSTATPAKPTATGDPSCVESNISSSSPPNQGEPWDQSAVASLNSLGYSPYTLPEYLSILQQLSQEHPQAQKTVIISVTGSPEQISHSYALIAQASSGGGGGIKIHFPLAMEVNLSCPNIPSFPPPAYSPDSLAQYLQALPEHPAFPVGIKTPPYTYLAQVASLREPLRAHASKISFITCVNTLGCSLLLDDNDGEDAKALKPSLPGSGMGGMAGAPLHPLALGNVKMIKDVLDGEAELRHVVVIGVGGVEDARGYRRMRKAGAHAVALATALGRLGTQVFSNMAADIKDQW